MRQGCRQNENIYPQGGDIPLHLFHDGNVRLATKGRFGEEHQQARTAVTAQLGTGSGSVVCGPNAKSYDALH